MLVFLRHLSANEVAVEESQAEAQILRPTSSTDTIRAVAPTQWRHCSVSGSEGLSDTEGQAHNSISIGRAREDVVLGCQQVMLRTGSGHNSDTDLLAATHRILEILMMDPLLSRLSMPLENCALLPGEKCAVVVGRELTCLGCRRWL